ncbi:MAG: hypothetical protein WAO76_11075 [Georgfuchsia sp.]
MISALIEFLAAYYQQGNVTGVMMVARNILDVIPDDIVAIQFLALALLQLGRREAAISLFHKAAGILNRKPHDTKTSVCELASSASYREATRPDTGLGEGWHRLEIVLHEFGFRSLAESARYASRQARATRFQIRSRPLKPAQIFNVTIPVPIMRLNHPGAMALSG